MRPIRKGDRGVAVEDVQRRLLTLGADLGLAGVDGVFLGATYAAVVAFQRERGLAEDGVVGPETWAALVDATFRLGDRLLYLRTPFLHGADVDALQRALNALGFACGADDAIFGPYTERAVREFQSNSGLAADGIVGPETVRAIGNLRHVWVDRPAGVPTALRAAPARDASCLAAVEVALAAGAGAGAVVDRVVNLAAASDERSRVRAGARVDGRGIVVAVGPETPAGVPTVSVGDGGSALSRRLAAALASGGALPPLVAVELPAPPGDEHATQALAVAILDGLCDGIAAAGERAVVS